MSTSTTRTCPRRGESRRTVAGELRRAQRRSVRRPARGDPRPAPLRLARLRDRSARLAAALRALGIAPGDTVSVMLHNTPEMVEAHYAVPALNAVLNTLNTRLECVAAGLADDHCEAKVLITDREFSADDGARLRCCATCTAACLS